MSKSKGNFYTISDLIAKGLDPLDIRYAMLSAHYASVYNFTFNGIASAAKARQRIQEFIYGVFDDEKCGSNTHIKFDAMKEEVFGAIANDLHTPKALGVLFTFINSVDPYSLDLKTKMKLREFFTLLNNIFAVWSLAPEEKIEIVIPDFVKKMADLRFNAKKSKNYATADMLRGKIEDEGYLVKDTKDGYEITLKN